MTNQTMQVQELKPKVDITTRPPLPPFTRESAIQKVRLAEDGWNSRDPEKVALAYTIDSRWRNRAEFANGRPEIIALLKRKWSKELDYRLIKELWAFTGNRIEEGKTKSDIQCSPRSLLVSASRAIAPLPQKSLNIATNRRRCAAKKF